MLQYLNTMTSGSNPLSDEQKYSILINHVNSDIYTCINQFNKYSEAIAHLKGIFVKTVNKCHARYLLATRRQKDGESIPQFIMALHKTSKECDFQAVDANVHCAETVRTAFISGIKSDDIRKRLLEETKSLDDTIKIAVTMEEASRNARLYSKDSGTAYSGSDFINALTATDEVLATNSQGRYSCGNCGKQRHSNASQCPARNSNCRFCSRKGHWDSVCRSKQRALSNGKNNPNAAAIPSATHLSNPSIAAAMCPSASILHPPPLENYTNDALYTSSLVPAYQGGAYYANIQASTPTFPTSLGNAVINVKVNSKINTFALIDTGSTLSFVSKTFKL